MAEPLIIGFDFGTTNSLITRILRNKAFPYLDEKQRPIPSVVSYEGLQVEAGASAKEKLGQAGLGVHGNIVRSPKAYLGDENIYFEGTQKRTVDVVSDLVRHVLNEAIEHPNDFPIEDLAGAVVTIPVDMQGYRRVALREAFSQANLRIIQFVHEPLAALYGHFRNQDNMAKISRTYDNQMILVFDQPSIFGDAYDIDLMLMMRSSRLINAFPDILPTFNQMYLALYVQALTVDGKYDALIGDAPTDTNLQLWAFGKKAPAKSQKLTITKKPTNPHSKPVFWERFTSSSDK